MIIELKHIKAETCPECGAGIRSATVGDMHSNGHRNETVSYNCYSEYHFSPNFMEIEVIRMCPQTAESRRLTRARQDCLDAARKLFETFSGVDDKFREQCLRNFQYISVR